MRECTRLPAACACMRLQHVRVHAATACALVHRCRLHAARASRHAAAHNALCAPLTACCSRCPCTFARCASAPCSARRRRPPTRCWRTLCLLCLPTLSSALSTRRARTRQLRERRRGSGAAAGACGRSCVDACGINEAHAPPAAVCSVAAGNARRVAAAACRNGTQHTGARARPGSRLSSCVAAARCSCCWLGGKRARRAQSCALEQRRHQTDEQQAC